MTKMIRVCVLADSLNLKVWQAEILKFIKHHPAFDLKCVLLNQCLPSKKSTTRIVYRLGMALDRAVFRSQQDQFNSAPFPFSSTTEIIEIKEFSKRKDELFIAKDIELIKRKEIDLFIRFGFGIIKGPLLEMSKYGVWSLHHGDNSVNRGGPPGFWEIVNGEHYTGVTLQLLNKELDGGRVLGKAFIKTDPTSFYRNQNAVFQAGVNLFIDNLKRLAQNDSFFYESADSAKVNFYSYPLYKDPNNREALLIFSLFWLRRIKDFFLQKITPEQWRLYYRYKKHERETVLFRFKELRPPKGTDWADPFIVFENSTYFVFIEEKHHSSKAGVISVLRFNEKGVLQDQIPKPVLKESFHLSYPFVFKNEGTHFMLPEMAQAGKVVLYKAVDFPYKWEPISILLDECSLYDPTLHFHQDKWYLFGTQRLKQGNSADMYLHIYYSDALNGTWQAHNENPIKQTVNGARPAGRLFYENGKLIRPAQIGAPKYGYGICFHEVEELTPTAFREKPISTIVPKWKKHLKATHTINFEGDMTVIDAQS
jgi:hypothetical protein